MATTDTQTLIDSANNVVSSATSVLPTNETLKLQLNTNVNKLQSLIDIFLQKGGIMTPEDKNSLTEQIRATQLSIMQAEAQNTNIKYGIYIASSLGLLAILWYFIYKKKSNE